MVGSAGMKEQPKRYSAFLLLLSICVVGAAVRIAVAFHGGIWADEAAFLLVAGAPSWNAMIDFLRYHESHPPLFYALMRTWNFVSGSGDVAELSLPVVIGVSIIPAIYFCGARLFSRRAALLAAALAAVSPSLVDSASQIRPYGLLPLLTLLSCFLLARAMDGGNWKQWTGYVFATTLLVYTHNWAWLVVGGECVAAALILGRDSAVRASSFRTLVFSWALIALAYVPWFPALLFQLRHAGHPPVLVENWEHALQFALFSTPAAFVMVLFGSLPGANSITVIVPFVVGIATAVATRLYGESRMRNDDPSRTSRPPARAHSEWIATLVFLVVPLVAVAGVVLFSTRTNLLFPRCLAMLAPLSLVLLAQWVDRRVLSSAPGGRSTFAAGLFSAVAAISMFAIVSLAQTTRSNAREVAAALSRMAQPTDLVIVMPEWYATSFNHYFGNTIDQVDYPHDGLGGMVDFVRVYERVADPRRVARLISVVRDANRSGRRVWLITGRNAASPVGKKELALATAYRYSPTLYSYRTKQLQDELRSTFGEPDTIALAGGAWPRYEETVPYLYTARSGVVHEKTVRR